MTISSSFSPYRLLLLVAVLLAGDIALTSTSAQAQASSNRSDRNREYSIANRLIRQGRYQQAYDILKEVHRRSPRSYPIFNRTITCLINLKRYDEAISLTDQRIARGYDDIPTLIKKGELFHLSGDTTAAFQSWETILAEHKHNLQAYQYLAETMQERKEYSRASTIYEQAREHFGNDRIFLFELAQSYLYNGEYEEAISEYLNLLSEGPDKRTFVQRQLVHFNDEYLYDIAILQAEEASAAFDPSNTYHVSLKELLIWIYLERDLFRKAFQTARQLEASGSSPDYHLFQLGSRLSDIDEFEIAEQAFLFYYEKPSHLLKARSMHYLAELYLTWTKYLEDYNLDFGTNKIELYTKAHDLLNVLLNDYPNYNRIPDALILQTELSLDYLHEPEEAKTNLQRLKSVSNSEDYKASIAYLEGRIFLFEGNYNQARVFFTRANRIARIGPLAEKTRYFLGETDFYGGDYEFAQIQVKALERQSSSLFANDALRLRIWIQEGKNPDSTTTELDLFSKARFWYETGRFNMVIDSLEPAILNDVLHPLADDMLMLKISALKGENPVKAFIDLDNYVNINPSAQERLYWEKAQIAFRIHKDTGLQDRLTGAPAAQLETINRLAGNVGEVIKVYEEIILNFPRGFYADYARAQIRKLQGIDV